jgi:hypothetical protein
LKDVASCEPPEFVAQNSVLSVMNAASKRNPRANAAESFDGIAVLALRHQTPLVRFRIEHVV